VKSSRSITTKTGRMRRKATVEKKINLKKVGEEYPSSFDEEEKKNNKNQAEAFERKAKEKIYPHLTCH
jgi:hypothetical protein